MATTVTTDQPTTDHSPEVLDAFVADRQAFWGRFTRFVTFGATAIAVLLILLTIFLV